MENVANSTDWNEITLDEMASAKVSDLLINVFHLLFKLYFEFLIVFGEALVFV